MDDATGKDPGVALLLAWLLPGAGHWYIEQRGRALLYGLAVIGMFVAGLWLGGLASVSAHEHSWAFLLQLFDGPISIAASTAQHAAQAAHAAPGATPAANEAFGGPTRLTDLGLTCTLVSAAFNILVMADAYYLADKKEGEEA